MKGNFIFISYAREDKEHALRLETDLKKEGVESFRDERSINPDKSFLPEIQDAINQSIIVAILWSEHANKADGSNENDWPQMKSTNLVLF